MTARATLLIVGTEMLDPARRDGNGLLARDRLSSLGIRLIQLTRIEDDVETLACAVKAALACSEVLLCSGGLGPTGDDLTRQGVASALSRRVVLDEPWLEELRRRVERRGRELTGHGMRQAMIVEGSDAIPNPSGLACGTYLDLEGKVVVLLPGIPSEFAGMLDDYVVPRLRERYPERPEVRVVRAVVAGLPEAQAEPVLDPWYGRTGVAVSILPASGVLKISFTITSPAAESLEAVEAGVRADLERGFGRHLVSLDGTSLEARIGELLLERGWTLATAESCTGGRAAHKLVSVSGASRYFIGGVVAYSNELKERLLGVPSGVIAAHGAVSEEVALAMMRGARERLGTSCAVAVTGIAGPEGGTPAKPVGLVHFAAGTPLAERARRIVFPLDRAGVQEIAANYALYTLWTLLREP